MTFTSLRTAMITAATLTAALAAPVHAAESQTFVRDGVTYTYTAESAGEATVLKGKADGTPFRLVVKGSRVTGRFNNNPISFTTADVAAERTLALR